jgi:hypothetical protein
MGLLDAGNLLHPSQLREDRCLINTTLEEKLFCFWRLLC